MEPIPYTLPSKPTISTGKSRCQPTIWFWLPSNQTFATSRAMDFGLSPCTHCPRSSASCRRQLDGAANDRRWHLSFCKFLFLYCFFSYTSPSQPLRRLTTHLVETYHICSPQYGYKFVHNPRRVLTKPPKPTHNDGFDNEDHDYILYVNDQLGSEEGDRCALLVCFWSSLLKNLR